MDFCALLRCFSFHPIRDCPYFEVATRLYFPTLDRWFIVLLSTLLVRSSHSIRLFGVENTVTKEFQPTSGYSVFGVCVLATIDTDKLIHGVK
jgi:hypothetical protein